MYNNYEGDYLLENKFTSQNKSIYQPDNFNFVIKIKAISLQINLKKNLPEP